MQVRGNKILRHGNTAERGNLETLRCLFVERQAEARFSHVCSQHRHRLPLPLPLPFQREGMRFRVLDSAEMVMALEEDFAFEIPLKIRCQANE
ncbi:hypothetical protein SUGI_0404840 [Cryptomeria japonica]|nr:hypothetical protein SUGI_0404840 [Cryptomeria japonica]